MKYMEGGGFQNHPLMRLTIGLTLVLLMAFWVTNLGLYFSKMGFDPASVVAYYNGSEEEFRPARTLGSMLEVTHAHLLMKALVMLLLTKRTNQPPNSSINAAPKPLQMKINRVVLRNGAKMTR